MTTPGKNEMVPGDGMPVTLRLNEGLGICEPDNREDAIPDGREGRVAVATFGQEHRADAIAVICKLSVLVPCLLICPTVSWADERPVLLDGGSMSRERFGQDARDVRFDGVAISMPGGRLDLAQGQGKRGAELDCGDSLSVAAVDADQKVAAEKCSGERGDGREVSQHWLWFFAGVLPILMFLTDAVLSRGDSDA